MFRLQQRYKPQKSGERLDFKFSHFQIFQVPRGWDKLFVSVISIETGKTVAKSSKVLIQNGQCQWTESLSASVWVSQDDASKLLEECLFKLVVAMGSARSGILGEAIVNLTDYMSSKVFAPVSLPLKKCNHGTTLQVKIQCLTPRTRFREAGHLKKTAPDAAGLDMEYDDMDNKSDGSDNVFNQSVGSSSSNNMVVTSHPGEFGTRDTSFSATMSHHSSDSGEGSVGRANSSPGNNSSTGELVSNLPRRQDSACPQNSGVPGPSAHLCGSNSSSVNSMGMRSGALTVQNQWQEAVDQSSPRLLAPPSLGTIDSSKSLLEAAEETIDELRAEARMWERNARNLKVDLEILRTEFSDQSRHHADQDMEISAAYAERDSLKLEINQLKSMLEESAVKQTTADKTKFQADDTKHLLKELQEEIQFKNESNLNLSLQLRKTQESNVELVSALQELEETIENQRLEIDMLSPQKTGKGSDDPDNLHGRTDTDEIRSLSLLVQELEDSQKHMQSIIQSLEKGMEDKSRQIEFERELRKQTKFDIEAEWELRLAAKEEKIIELEAKSSDLLTNRNSQAMGPYSGVDTNQLKEIEVLQSKVQELERDCIELTNENLELIFKMKESGTDSELHSQSFMEDSCQLNAELAKRQQVETYQIKDNSRSRNFGPDTPCEISKIISELDKQLQITFRHVNGLWYATDWLLNKSSECENDLGLSNYRITDFDTQKEQGYALVNCVFELNKLLDRKIIECKAMFQHSALEIRERDSLVSEAQRQLKDYILKECDLYKSIQELEDSRTGLQSEIVNLREEQAMDRFRIQELEDGFSLKKQETEPLRISREELESLILDLKKEKEGLEVNLDDVRQDLKALTCGLDSNVSAKNMLDKKLMELESGKRELEAHLSELEEENVQLSERVSGLEAQLRYLTEERESGRLELESSRSHVVDLENEIRRLEIQIEMQKADLKQRLQETQKRCSEIQEELEFSKRDCSNLQSKVKTLIEECDSHRKMNMDLKRQGSDLHEHHAYLEGELVESQKKFFECLEKVELLEVKLLSMQKEAASKEKALASETEALLLANKEHEKKLNMAENLLNQMGLEKKVEIENLQREVACLTTQISSTNDERKTMASHAILEAASLRAEKNKVENSLQEAYDRIQMYETEIHNLRLELGNKVQGLVGMLAAAKQNEEQLVADRERIQKLLDSIKSSEGNFKSTAHELEIKLKASNYERKEQIEEIGGLHAQLQKMTHLQDEVLAIKSSLDDMRFEKSRLEESLQSVSADCKELRTERVSLVKKISDMQKALSEGEEGRRSQVALEEKLMRLECDLTAREALSGHEAEIKNELGRLKRANSQYQRKIQNLEEEKGEYLKRTHTLEEKLKVMKNEDKHWDEKRVLSESNNKDFVGLSNCATKVNGLLEKDDNKLQDCTERLKESMGNDLIHKIRLLENELAEALDANDMYKVQLKSLCSDWQDAEGETVGEGYKNKALKLEAELKDMRERYFHMSLRFAEVEAQREELVMKVKSLRNGKRWLF